MYVDNASTKQVLDLVTAHIHICYKAQLKS